MRLLLTATLLLFAQTLFCQNIEYWEYHDTVSFETTKNYLQIDPGSSWVIGVPGKTLFDSAYTPTRAIFTDTGYYGINDTSVFTLNIPPIFFSQVVETRLSFWQKFDMDSLNDFGAIEVSYDLGTTWVNLITDTTYRTMEWESYGYYGALSGTADSIDKRYTGRLDTWSYEEFWWTFYLPVKQFQYPSSIWVRFVFTSDSVQNNREGWMIDDMVLFTDEYAGINSINRNNLQTHCYPNPATDILTINTNAISSKGFEVSVYNTAGEMVLNRHAMEGRIPIYVSHLPPGTYYYLLETLEDQSSGTGSFVVQ